MSTTTSLCQCLGVCVRVWVCVCENVTLLVVSVHTGSESVRGVSAVNTGVGAHVCVCLCKEEGLRLKTD